MTTTTAARAADTGPTAPTGRARYPHRVRWATVALLAATAVLYVVDLSASGYANSFYAAAVQAGSQSWKAWFFGSLDTQSFITVDKPPASLWVSGLAARAFGFSSWTLLVPQALEGVGAVWLLTAAVRRWHGPVAGLVAGAALALTPAAALIFRFDNPDALLVLLMTLAAYCTVRATEKASWRWLAWAGVAIGFAFLTKMLQGFLVLPGLALVHLWAAPTGLGKRVLHLLGAGLAVVVSAGWWVLAVTFWPGEKPYIGGSTDGTVMNLVLGYNGLGRILGSSGNGGGGGGMSGGTAGSSFGGEATWRRLFSSEFGNEISWLLPAALLALVLGLIARGRAPRTDRARASLVLWGGWLLVSGATFAYMEGTVHPYYTVALAPAVAALAAGGGQVLWTRRAQVLARVGLALVLASAGVWAFVLLHRNGTWVWAGWVLMLVSVALSTGFVVTPARLRRLAIVLVLSATVVGFSGTASYAVATAATPHTGSIPTVGPAGAAAGSGMGGFGGGGFGGARGTVPSQDGTQTRDGAPQGFPGTTDDGSTSSAQAPTGEAPAGDATGQAPTGGGGFGEGASTNTELTTLLQNAGTRWAAAVSGSQSAASYELATGTAIMAMGGWSDDPTPTLAQFQQYVAAGEVHYLISGGGMGGGRGGSDSDAAKVQEWVAANYAELTVGGTTVYDLTQPLSSTGTSSSTSSGTTS
ncbi:ArnT family glycosyltransferase [Kineococcus rhizosphaerae]|uniref:4-amino-4-deoxy-L-arabinose transferase-like glycosyltransferase n=1 Tax=Kineococcus rhizosphaerae TaxID=559628 RepID=A0A2T0R107_9ACTN|nr:glycosyltransferase family 39 protein [Kineococcus rhizosphaerae]PRY13004.1 4-amino-4-deoxy-L-arabinose transferase-like glycosyltransferase [Kineococcus rhizosphaerae]